MSVTGSSNRLSGTLAGEFHVFETESIWSRSIAWCYWSDIDLYCRDEDL